MDISSETVLLSIELVEVTLKTENVSKIKIKLYSKCKTI